MATTLGIHDDLLEARTQSTGKRMLKRKRINRLEPKKLREESGAANMSSYL